jgi:hypothetical protein
MTGKDSVDGRLDSGDWNGVSKERTSSGRPRTEPPKQPLRQGREIDWRRGKFAVATPRSVANVALQCSGYYPSGLLGFVLLVFVLFLVSGRLSSFCGAGNIYLRFTLKSRLGNSLVLILFMLRYKGTTFERAVVRQLAR